MADMDENIVGLADQTDRLSTSFGNLYDEVARIVGVAAEAGGLFDFFNYREILGSTTIYMPVGSRAFVEVQLLTDPSSVVHEGGKLDVVQTGAFGGVYKVINENNAYISRTDFDYPINAENWKLIKDSPYKRVSCSYNGGQLSGFPIDVTRNINTGDASVSLYQGKGDVNG